MWRILVILLSCLGTLFPETVCAGGKVPAGSKQKSTLLDEYGEPLPPGAVARIGSLKFRQPEGAWNPVFSNDGKLFATGAPSDTITLWDYETGKAKKKFQGGRFDLSPDGKWIAMQVNRSLQVREIKTGNLIKSFEDNRSIDKVFFTRDGKKLLAVGYPTKENKLVSPYTLWEWDTTAWAHKAHGLPGDWPLAVSGDGNWVAVGVDQEVKVYQVEGFKLQRTLRYFPNEVTSLAFSPDGKLLAAGRSQGEILLLKWQEGKEIDKWQGHKEDVQHLIFLPDGSYLLSKSQPGIKLWHIEGHKLVAEMPCDHPFRPYEPLKVSPDGKWLAAGPRPTFWELPSGKEKSQGIPGGGIVQFSDDGKTLVTGKSHISLWDVATRKVRKVVKLGQGPNITLAVSPDGKTLAYRYLQKVGSDIWDLEGGKLLKHLTDRPKPGVILGISPENKSLVVLDGNSLMTLQDLRTQKTLLECRQPVLPGNLGPISRTTFVFSRDGRLLAIYPEMFNPTVTGNQVPQGIFLVDAKTGKLIFQLKGGPGYLSKLAFSPDGRYLAASGYLGSNINVWELATGQLMHSFFLEGKSFSACLTFSPDGRTLACSNKNSVVSLLELASVKPWHEFSSLQGWSEGLDFSPDGKLLASANNDHTTLVWAVPEAPWKKGATLTAQEMEDLGDQLGSTDGARALQAAWKLVDTGPQSVPFLEKKLFPQVTGELPLRKLIQDMDSDKYKIRIHAVQQLTQSLEMAEPLLKETLGKNISLELSLRIRQLLKELNPQSPRHLFQKRAVMVLEHEGSLKARQVLQQLVQSIPTSIVGQEASVALKRMEKKQG